VVIPGVFLSVVLLSRVLRERIRARRVFGKQDVDSLLDMGIGEFIQKYKPPSTHYIVVRKGTKLYNVLKAIATGHPVLIVIVDEKRRPIGYISEFELLRMFSRRPRYSFFIAGFSLARLNIPIENALNIPVEKIMEDRPFVIREKTSLRELLNLARNLHLSSIIVVDDKGRLKTVLTLPYLMKTLLRILLGEPILIY